MRVRVGPGATGAAVGEQRQQLLGEEERAFEDDTVEAVVELLGNVGEQRRLAEAGVVDEVVERAVLPAAAELGGHAPREVLEAAGGADVEPQPLLTGIDDVATVGYRVGYDSTSQFSREYRRQFGLPPGRDAARLRAAATA